jgi:hypothetical protein
MAYRTSKAKIKSVIGFSPIRNGLAVDGNEGFTQQMVDLINDIKRIMTVYGKSLCLLV